jgi:hypothetical protein
MSSVKLAAWKFKLLVFTSEAYLLRALERTLHSEITALFAERKYLCNCILPHGGRSALYFDPLLTNLTFEPAGHKQ